MSDLSRPLIPRDEWLLDPDVTFINHGSFGAVRTLIAEQRRVLLRPRKHRCLLDWMS